MTVRPTKIRIENRISIKAKPIVGTQMALSGRSGRLKVPVAMLLRRSSKTRKYLAVKIILLIHIVSLKEYKRCNKVKLAHYEMKRRVTFLCRLMPIVSNLYPVSEFIVCLCLICILFLNLLSAYVFQLPSLCRFRSTSILTQASVCVRTGGQGFRLRIGSRDDGV